MQHSRYGGTGYTFEVWSCRLPGSLDVKSDVLGKLLDLSDRESEVELQATKLFRNRVRIIKLSKAK